MAADRLAATAHPGAALAAAGGGRADDAAAAVLLTTAPHDDARRRTEWRGSGMTQVLITGMGAVSCLGAGVPAMWRALCAAPDSLPERAGDPGARMPLPLIHMAPAGPGSGRATRLALTAAREAVADAGLDPGRLARSPVIRSARSRCRRARRNR
ncbi:hypothetical protein M1P56_22335 [Streptomyces sp. HU2014]|uniref:hypothetical protein n=1 Tax=Streptomyces sp. HU2014 TaxID=2939414 RepID=UPI00200C7450|nr:hypothetical protein [Streptomyces sp. HU2014]UQI46891.1 hypothetical protein M1P56_22335 [Streptomyces sp. HU2014]